MEFRIWERKKGTRRCPLLAKQRNVLECATAAQDHTQQILDGVVLRVDEEHGGFCEPVSEPQHVESEDDSDRPHDDSNKSILGRVATIEFFNFGLRLFYS